MLEGRIADSNSFKPPYPAGKEATTAKRHGLMVTGHHMLVLGSSYNDWDKYWENVKQQPTPRISITEKEKLCEFWSFHIDLAQRSDLDVIWHVGFRGNRDIPFWEFFPNSPTDDPSRAKFIEDMVNKEKLNMENLLIGTRMNGCLEWKGWSSD